MTAEPVDIATVPCFVGLEETHVTFISQSRLTSSDVLAITITTMKRMLPQTLLPRSMSNGQMKLSLPAAPVTLSIPRKRMNKILHAERDAFMKKLYAERSTRTMLECWAAIRIQALFRGYRVRPHAKTIYDNRRANLPAVIRKEACVKRFLARVAFIHLTSRHIDELVLWSVIVVQAAYRGYSVRKRVAAMLTQLREVSAIKIQSLVRYACTQQPTTTNKSRVSGVLGRERVALLHLERFAAQGEEPRRDYSGATAATTIQRLVRGRKGRKSVDRLRQGRWMVKLQVDSGVMTIEPRPSLRPPLNINTTHLHQDVAATKLQAFTRGSQTRQRQRSGRVMGPPKLPRASSKTNLLGEMRKNVYSVEDTAVAAAMLEDVHAAEFRHRAQRYMQSMASMLPKAEVLVQGTVGQGRPKTLTSTRPNKTAPILPRTEETEFHMYAPVEKLVKRCPSTAAKVKLPDEVDAALEAATKIQALVRGSMARSNTKDSKKLSRGVVVGRH
ncbi:hypothetical protein DYB25_003131 [Aphanomyces astaci]|uniref:Uncharacterized protein n=1 Tax=Aphanomyces astaci TaxID=112090 RepID=A0A397CXK7_APHAT|nr:hypothetical protein DYB25_003131 [Aphanomyces astaci]RHY51277.1 hypothetical protein DYB38_002755 [Aphanomyces astaci]RHY51464.1 hypothetical protein DYB30_002183 [Aphanomyces astaci]RHY51800.1 hypothetical protein DYB34_006981 [Aphanomyces astaci]RHY81176.1 hypothetical protein DYB31_002236 [Aphanomyces astaci]